MGYARETIVGYVDSLTGTTVFDALIPNANQSFTVRSFTNGTGAELEDIWGAFAAHAGLFSIHSPRMHDDVRGIQVAINPLSHDAAANFNPQAVIPGAIVQELYSTDVLSVTVNGTASDAFVGVFNVQYDDLDGVNGHFVSWSQIQGIKGNYAGVLVSPQASGTVGILGSGVALNSSSYVLKANTYYAWLGYQTSIPVAAVVLNGTDVGNLNVGGPGSFDQSQTGDFFIRQSVSYGNRKTIPIINSNNAGGINVFVADAYASTHPNVTLMFKELGQTAPY